MQKNILITGGSSGIGEGLARHFYNKGWGVLITGRNTERLSKLANEMPGLHVLEYDSLKEDQEQPLIQFIRQTWNGKLDVLVNNAGHVALTPIHLIAPSLLASGCIEFLTASKGQIINVSSSVGIKPSSQLSAYGSAKAGMNMLTKIWALELAPLGIRVNSIAPGPTDTPVLANAGLPPDVVQAIHDSERATIPLQRRGSVEDIVVNMALLIDSGSTWVTGVVLPVDGGISIT